MGAAVEQGDEADERFGGTRAEGRRHLVRPRQRRTGAPVRGVSAFGGHDRVEAVRKQRRVLTVRLLKVAGVLSSFVAGLHVFVIFRGGAAYRYFGAGERMAHLAEQGSPVPTLVTAGLALVFATWAAYAFSGAGMLPRAPYLRLGLVLIGSIYVMRGVLLGPQLLWWFEGYRNAVPVRQLVFSLAALVTGTVYLEGTRAAWAKLGRRQVDVG
jgi:hypothetical protein